MYEYASTVVHSKNHSPLLVLAVDTTDAEIQIPAAKNQELTLQASIFFWATIRLRRLRVLSLSGISEFRSCPILPPSPINHTVSVDVKHHERKKKAWYGSEFCAFRPLSLPLLILHARVHTHTHPHTPKTHTHTPTPTKHTQTHTPNTHTTRRNPFNGSF